MSTTQKCIVFFSCCRPP